MPVSAGKFRHVVKIEKKVSTQIQSGPGAGSMEDTWVTADKGKSVPAWVRPLKGREFIAARAVNSELSYEVGIRWRPDIDSSVRLIWRGRILNPAGWVVDAKYGNEYLVSYCTEGPKQGG